MSENHGTTASYPDPVSTLSMSWREALDRFDVRKDRGLEDRQVEARRKRFGPNLLQEIKAKSAWLILADQLKSLIAALLIVALVLSFFLGDILEAEAIAVVLLINTAIGFFTELKAVRSMESLRKLGSVTAKVRRNGRVIEISADDLVPGDIALFDGGDVVTADIRLTEASRLQVDESTLTGESLPVKKTNTVLEHDVPLAERINMLFKGTAVTGGSAEGVVVATGMNTELGYISTLVAEARAESTPLEQKLDQLGRKLIWITLAIAVFVIASGVITGKDTLLMIEMGIALAVAAIPEGLPVVATIALARGMWRMARLNALVNRLSSVETLGATTIICTDKTGTLTENRMTVTRLSLPDGDVEVTPGGGTADLSFRRDESATNPNRDERLREALLVGVLCNNAALGVARDGEAGSVGDPMEVALLAAAAGAGIERAAVIQEMPEEREEAFDSDIKMMATFHRKNGQYYVAVKGAAESVLECCTHQKDGDRPREMDDEGRAYWLRRNEDLALGGYRVLALASKQTGDLSSYPYENLSFIGLVGLHDPPREDVPRAMEACHGAGIRVVMVTGDQPVTARNIAMSTGLLRDEGASVLVGRDLKRPEDTSPEEKRALLQAPILARVSPKQKLDLIALYQESGEIVAMTGDGVNDAPALKKADIGIAMGLRGTQVAREAADMILKDDAFSTIVVAIEQGRIIFDNIRKFVFYLMSCNVSEILIVSIAALVNAPLPILPLQILFLNILTDVFPALALGFGEGDASIMGKPPRDPAEQILTRRHWWSVFGYGLAITASVLVAFAMALLWLNMGIPAAVSVSFLALALAQVWHVFNMRHRGSGLFSNEVTRNPFVWGAIGLCLVLLLAAVYIPVVGMALRVFDPGPAGWMVAVTSSLVPLFVGQVWLSLTGRAEGSK
jgi:Ca2+-transporting ATPase